MKAKKKKKRLRFSRRMIYRITIKKRKRKRIRNTKGMQIRFRIIIKHGINLTLIKNWII
jgi:hypothetical protein